MGIVDPEDDVDAIGAVSRELEPPLPLALAPGYAIEQGNKGIRHVSRKQSDSGWKIGWETHTGQGLGSHLTYCQQWRAFLPGFAEVAGAGLPVIEVSAVLAPSET